MPKIPKRPMRIVIGLAIGLAPLVGLVLAFGGWGRVGFALAADASGLPSPSPSPTFVDVHPTPSLPLNDCATTDFSALARVEEVDTYFDPGTRTFDIAAYLSGGGKAHFVVNVDDPACMSVPRLGVWITGQLTEYAQQLAIDCADTRAHLAGAPVESPPPGKGPMVFNPAAGQHFVDESCGGASGSPTPAA